MLILNETLFDLYNVFGDVLATGRPIARVVEKSVINVIVMNFIFYDRVN